MEWGWTTQCRLWWWWAAKVGSRTSLPWTKWWTTWEEWMGACLVRTNFLQYRPFKAWIWWVVQVKMAYSCHPSPALAKISWVVQTWAPWTPTLRCFSSSNNFKCWIKWAGRKCFHPFQEWITLPWVWTPLTLMSFLSCSVCKTQGWTQLWLLVCSVNRTTLSFLYLISAPICKPPLSC